MSIKVKIKRKITTDLLIELMDGGYSGGDQDGRFTFTSIDGENLEEPFSIPHEAVHMVEAIQRMKMSLSIILKGDKG